MNADVTFCSVSGATAGQECFISFACLTTTDTPYFPDRFSSIEATKIEAISR